MKLPRFQFRLRTLMTVVTLLAVACAYFARSIQVTRERNSMLDHIRFVDQGDTIRYGHREDGLVPPDENTSGFPVPWDRRLFGDEAIALIFVPTTTDRHHLSEIHSIFPEAKIGLVVIDSLKVRHFVRFVDF
jgi:hypothetical protein